MTSQTNLLKTIHTFKNLDSMFTFIQTNLRYITSLRQNFRADTFSFIFKFLTRFYREDSFDIQLKENSLSIMSLDSNVLIQFRYENTYFTYNGGGENITITDAIASSKGIQERAGFSSPFLQANYRIFNKVLNHSPNTYNNLNYFISDKKAVRELNVKLSNTYARSRYEVNKCRIYLNKEQSKILDTIFQLRHKYNL